VRDRAGEWVSVPRDTWWQEHVPNTTVLKYATSVELRHFCRLHSFDGVDIRMDNTWIPKQVFYGQLHHGFRRPGGQYKRYKDCLKSTMTQCGITPSELETLAMDRTGWRSTCKSAVEEFEVRRIQELEAKRDLCKSGPPSTSNFECQICHRMSFTNRASSPQQVPPVMMRPIVSTAQWLYAL